MRLKKSVKIILIVITIVLLSIIIIPKYLPSKEEDKKVQVDYTKYQVYLDKGYKKEELKYIDKLSNLNKDKIKKIDYIDIKNYCDIKNFDVDKFERYEKYKNNNKNINYQDVVTFVNINNDLKAYEVTNKVKDPNDLLVLVNKYNGLPNNYVPSDLEYLDGAYGNKVPMRKIIVDDFIKLQKLAKEELNINLMPTTAFRNYNFQNTLYTNYVKKDGKEAADTYSARPGYSEHQTGLAIDLKNMTLNSKIRLTDKDYEWLQNNSYKFGFIIRFPKEKEHITKYQFENWHIRYVGKDNAKIMYDNKLTLEEYLDLYKKEY